MTRLLAVAAVALAGVILLGLALFVSVGSEGESESGEGRYLGSEPPAGIELPRLSLRDYRGLPVRDGDLRGKAVAITFLDTQCEEACPVIARQVALAFGRLAPGTRGRAVAYALSVDPVEDTPTRVRAFLRRQGAERALGYLVGPEDALRRAWRAFQVLPSVESGDDDIHSAPVRIYDPAGEWVSTLHSGVDLTPESLAHDLEEALASRPPS